MATTQVPHISILRRGFMLTMQKPRMTLSAASAISVAPRILSHITGKERDPESGNDYMFARCLRYKLSLEDRRVVPAWSSAHLLSSSQPS
jgi:hypothetical protein